MDQLYLIIQTLINQQFHIKNRTAKIKKEMNQYPSGQLCVRKKQGVWHFYQTKPHSERSLKKSCNTTEFLARKYFLQRELTELDKLCNGIGKLIEEYQTNVDLPGSFMQSRNTLNMSKRASIREKRIAAIFPQCVNPLLKKEVAWKDTTCNSNTRHPENLIYLSACGTIVRSKSELAIINFLTSIKAVFRYEPELIIDGELFYPDFVILLSDGSLLIWEHLGLAGNSGYDESTVRKLNAYRKAGFYTHSNLILTYEEDVRSEEQLMDIFCKYYH